MISYIKLYTGQSTESCVYILLMDTSMYDCYYMFEVWDDKCIF